MSQRETTKHDIQRDELNSNRVGFSVVSRIHVSGSVGMAYTGIDSGTGEVTIISTGTINGSNNICDGRLTLSSGTAIPTSDLTAQTRVWLTPYVGNKISLYDGSSWSVLSFDSPSVAVPSITTGTFDVFAYNNGGVIALETANWTNDSTRATALVRQDGVLVKSGAATRRYLGTARTTTSSGQCEDSTTKRFLWNMYNRAQRDLFKQDATSHTYTAGSNRAWNNDSNNKVELVLGQADIVPTSVSGVVKAGADGENAFITVGYDGSIVTDTAVGFFLNYNIQYAGGAAGGNKSLAAGCHYVTALESGGPSASGFTQVQLKAIVYG